MINVLFIVYEFPPLNSGGSHRPYRFVKHLRQFNINPIVVTPEVIDQQQDSSLAQELQDITVIRTALDTSVKFESLLSKNYFNILDIESKKWEKHLTPVLERLVKEFHFEAMYVTAPPFSIANLGVNISKRFNLPLILDMRDHWSHWNITPFTSYLHYKAILNKEKQWFKHASAVLAVSEQMIVDFEIIHSDINYSKFYTVRNSYEKEIVIERNKIRLRKPTIQQPLKIGYVGSFYYHPYQRDLIFNPWWKKKPHQWFQYTPREEDWLYRSPYFFFKTLKKLIEIYPELAQLITVEFIGATPNWLVDMIKEFGLIEHVQLKGFLPHQESMLFQKKCDALLGTSMKVVDGRDYCIAGKSYEYIYQQKPILAFMTEGTQKDFFKESGMGVIFEADNLNENLELFKKFIEGGIDFFPNKEFVKQINTKETTQKLANIIKKVIDT